MEQTTKPVNCRVCLRYDLEKQIFFFVFEKYNDALISDRIKYVTNIDVKENDGYPELICPECLLQLESAVDFKQKFETSDKILRALVNKPKPLKVPVPSVVNGLLEIAEVGSPDVFENEVIEPVAIGSDTEENTTKKNKPIQVKLICDDCGESFKSKCKLAVHWRKVHQPEKLICQKCKRVFKSFKAYNVHIKTQSRSCRVADKIRVEGLGRDRVFHCLECTYSTKRIKDMDAHLTTHTGDRRFHCRDCPKSFTQHSSLQGHREAYHKDYKVETTCHVCGKHIQGRSKYYKHLRIHRPKSVQCEICKKMFKCRTNLNTHMKRHSGVRSYICEICPANFFTLGELCNHRRRVHQKAKKYHCDICEYSSYTEASLKTHKARHTLSNVACLTCGMFLENAEKLEIHQKRHVEKNYQCPHCDKKFFAKDSIHRHIMKHHSTEMTMMPLGKIKAEKEKAENSMNIKQECKLENKYDHVITLSP
ncbi:zinc finger protein 665-like [Trichoplusia ni]|uniref:Zinc finger protein 665-like n=1 Tax=Trichoplusia ni TaxID=7111 RepID=A0A7E5VKF2_TRINI|nr:zinc finger protein 665-like [Trichoplusia ni]